MFPGCCRRGRYPSRNTWLKKVAAALVRTASMIVAGGDRGLAVVDRDAVDPLLRHHAPGGAAPVDGRHAVGRVAGEILGQLRRCGGLDAQIHLDAHDVGEGLDDFDRLQAPQRGWVRSTSAASQRMRSRSRAKARSMPGPQHLDRDLGRLRSVLASRRNGPARSRRRRPASSSNVVNSRRSGCPSSASIVRRASRRGKWPAGGPAGAPDRPRPPRRAGRRGSTASGRA